MSALRNLARVPRTPIFATQRMGFQTSVTRLAGKESKLRKKLPQSPNGFPLTSSRDGGAVSGAAPVMTPGQCDLDIELRGSHVSARPSEWIAFGTLQRPG